MARCFLMKSILAMFSRFVLAIFSRFMLMMFVCVNVFCYANIASAEEKILIAVNQFVSHVALDKANSGLKKALTDRGILPDRARMIFGNSQGNITNSVQISKHHASLEPAFMVSIGTPSAQTGLKAKSGKTILGFLAVTDPAAANLEQKQVIGVTDNPPIRELIDITLQVFPELKTVGVISNAGEVNSQKVIENLEKILAGHNIALKKAVITNPSDIKAAMNKLAGSVDLIYIPQDNSVVSALSHIARLSNSLNIPLIANDPTLSASGVMIALGANYFSSGMQLGNMIADLIEGKGVRQNIQGSDKKELKINHKIAKMLGVSVPKNIKEGDK
ncbi:MAG: hypothetical protein COA94_05345 [Rickettsiales bacterium]|nr:MAG: hypothetical protein COA94_05345 [Rickettsiales bacterium]